MRWRRPLAGLAVVAAVLGGSPAVAAPADPGSAAQLQREADARAKALADEQASQQAADARAAAALEAFQVAQRRASEAARTAADERAALATARLRTDIARTQLSRYLGSVYRSGVGNGSLQVMSDLIAADSAQALFSGLSMADRIGSARNDQLDVLRSAQAEQTAATQRADRAATAATDAAAAATQAKAAAERVVAEQQLRVADAARRLAASQQAVAVARAREAALAKAEALARARSAVPPLAALVGASTPRPDATCKGGSTAGYANGRIPAEVLCPLWGTSGQILRADAAAAFDAMSKAYAETFSAPICVTDSYRSYDEQVVVRAAKPALAAVPGTSNHGWGVAVDLCDGVQRFGTPQHRWLQANAMAFGWFHPAWAQAGGSKPEAWHWEFAG